MSSDVSAADQATAAAASLQLLLREDPLLIEHGMTELNPQRPDEAAIPYAAALLQQDTSNKDSSEPQHSAATASSSAKERADWALQDVERKLALVESLAVKLSRTSPEAVAGHLLRLHGYQVVKNSNSNNPNRPKSGENDGSAGATTSGLDDTTESTTMMTTATTTTTASLSAIRERADRLERQSHVLETVAKRVEGSLQRGLDRMNVACLKLQRVLALSTTLKMILRAQFENSKLQSYDLEDLRDLTKAAASVAILEDLFQNKPELSSSSSQSTTTTLSSSILLVEMLRPEAMRTAAAVRRAAQELLEKYYQEPTAVQQLGATLQVYFHLGELPQAVWRALDFAHAKAETVSRQLWNPTTLLQMAEQAAATTRTLSSSSSDAARSVAKRLVLLRLEAADVWSQGIADATTSVRNLQRVLRSKTDPESRQAFLDVVAHAPIPSAYRVSNQQPGGASSHPSWDFSLVALFWQRFCRTLAGILEEVLQQVDKHHKLERADVAALYPPVRRVAKNLVGQLQESFSTATGSAILGGGGYEDGMGASGMTGILGGSRAFDTAFMLQWSSAYRTSSTTIKSSSSLSQSRWLSENPQEGAQYSADTWTQRRDSSSLVPGSTSSFSSGIGQGGGANVMALTSAIFQSKEWKALSSNSQEGWGLYPLQRAFVEACTKRLCQPLQYMFPDNLVLGDDGVPLAGAGGLSLLPSKFDIQRFDDNIRQELSLADPKEGGGECTAVTMIAECVVDMITQFCSRARNAMSGASDENYLQKDVDHTNWSMTEALQHDRKVAAIMYTLHTYLESGPETTFIAPYRPATSPQQEEAAALCLAALQPALRHINNMVKTVILDPLCRASNRRLANMLATIHLGIYMEGRGGGGGEDAGGAVAGEEEVEMSASFVQNELAPVYEAISSQMLTKFPPPYASIVAANVACFSIYGFLSNAVLVRPLGESARLHLTQDLADLELALEQLVLRGSGSTNTLMHLSQIDHGRPYAELRAVRQMLFWNGFDSKHKTGSDLAKALLREAWIRDVRPSTVIHYLFSFAPSLLSSPHHSKRMKAEDYVFSHLVHYDGSVDHGEEDAWLVTLSCCDSYAQRASSAQQHQQPQPLGDGDPRVADVLLNLGPELLRRRRH